jgi:hypothetical protein
MKPLRFVSLEEFRGDPPALTVRACATCFGNGDGVEPLEPGRACIRCGCRVTVMVRTPRL